MAIPSSGPTSASMINVELGRAAAAPFSINGAEERNLAASPSGLISFWRFRGKSSLITKTMAASNSPVTLQSLFTAAEWTSSINKKVVLPAGAVVGSSNTSAAAVSIGAAWGGDLSLEVSGFILGAPGAANSGTGGNALNANTTGSSGQKLNVDVLTGGLIYAGGGGGGVGGNGGAGYYTVTNREPASGWYSTLRVTGISGIWLWGGTYLAANGASVIYNGGYTYYKGPRMGQYNEGGSEGTTYPWFGIARTWPSNVWTSGGWGGAGGRGDGFTPTDWGAKAGAGGSAPGPNAGWGGTGGTGGTWGLSGAPGAPGGGGNGAGGTAERVNDFETVAFGL